MKFETLLQFWIAHNEVITQWILAVIVGSITWLFFRSIFAKPKENSVSGNSSLDLSEVQFSLKKIIDQTAALEKTIVSVPAATNGTGGADPVEMARLKKQIQEREDELNRLKADPIGDKLRAQITRVQELEGRLKEYEILEDDIADLSLYKEENLRLKQELEKMAVSVAGGAVEPVETIHVTGAEPAANPDALVAEFANVVDQTKGIEGSGDEGPAMTIVSGGNNPMDDFAAIVETKKTREEPVIIISQDKTPPAAAPVAAVVAVPAPAEPAAAEGSENLFAEFSSGNLDTDRVMEELIHLEKHQGGDSETALEESVDADKMVAEAAGFSKH